MATNANIQININSKGAEKSLNTLYADLEATREELDRLIKTYGENSKEADKMRKSLVGLETEISKLGGATEMAENSVGSLKAQLRQMTNELAGLEPGSARFEELSVKAGQLRDRIQDTNAVINATAGSSLENFGRALGNATQLGVAGFQSIVSVQALFGSENEELQKTLVKMGALLNLSQALETFGGLSDRLTQIKAGFTPLLVQLGLMKTRQTEVAVSTAAADAALVGEAVAADGAAVSTGIFGAALNALPLVAIVSAIGLLVAGLISYATTSGEAEKAEKKRTATLKAQREEQDRARKSIASESGEFLMLIERLKQTNRNSEERRDLIKEINSTYGTTFSNLENEIAFQAALNLAVEDYITLKTNEYKLTKNQEAFNKIVEKEGDAIKKRDAAQKAYLAAQKKINESTNTPYYLELENLDRLKKSYESAQAVVESYTKRKKYLAGQDQELLKTNDELTNGGKRYEVQTNKNINATDKNTASQTAYEDALKSIQKIIDETNKLEEENFLKTQELSKKKVDTKEIERNKLTESVRKEYLEIKASIEKEITDETKKFERLAQLEKVWVEFQKKLNEQEVLDNNLTNQKILESQTTLLDTLKKEQAALRDEIRFGDGDTSDTLIANSNRVRENAIRDLETQNMRSKLENRLSVKRFEESLIEKRDLQILYYKVEQKGQMDAAKAERDRLMDLETQKYNLKEEFNISFNENTKKYEVKVKDEVLNNLKGTEEDKKKIRENYAQEQILLQNNLNKTAENLDEQYNQKLQTSTSETAQKIKQIQIDTEDSIFQNRIDKLDEYLDYAQQAFSEFNNIIQQAQELQLQNEETRLNDSFNLQQQRLEQQLQNNLITQEEYDARVKQIETQREQDLLQMKRKQFQTDKKLNIVQATMDATRATLSVFANTPGELIIKSIAAGIAAAFGAAQVALIAKQQFTAAVGGIVPGNGSGNVDSVDAKLAPGEAVINSNSTNAFLPLLDIVNRLGGGKSLMPELPGDNGVNRFQPVFQQPSNQNIRAYVVQSDIESNMTKMNRIRRSTRF